MGKTIFQFENNILNMSIMNRNILTWSRKERIDKSKCWLIDFYKRLSRKKSSIFPEYENQYEDMLYTTYKNLVKGR